MRVKRVNPRVETGFQLDQFARVACWFVVVGLFQFCVGDGEGGAFDDVCGVAGEFEVAMIGSPAGCDELLVVDPGDS